VLLDALFIEPTVCRRGRPRGTAHRTQHRVLGTNSGASLPTSLRDLASRTRFRTKDQKYASEPCFSQVVTDEACIQALCRCIKQDGSEAQKIRT
jgi:hypothetical protein